MNDSYSKLTISSNFIFTRVMRDPRLLKKLLERVMPEKNISDLNVVIEEKTFDEFYDAHGIRLDVYSENEESVFDVEMQVLEKDLPAKRARYYEAIMDAAFLNKGEDYRKLKEQYVIFFCLYDPFGDNMMVYRFRNQCLSNGRLLEDGTEKIYINCTAKEAGEYESLRPFAEYVMGKMNEDPFVREVDESVYLAKQNAGWRKEYMLLEDHLRHAANIAREEALIEGRAEGLAEGRAEGLAKGREEGLKKGRTESNLKFLKILMTDGRTFEEACAYMELDQEEAAELAELLNQ